eukprot:GHVP01068464.1.p1 GENE.GHVP01068464.1~~GHVP01068464.1.p1  ORF type:complete len:218 (-),score=58.00 GHVP01068464.1:73-726(-)
MSYDKALTIFSPDGHLFQVDYAIKAVEKGSAVVGAVGSDFIVIGVEKRDPDILQKEDSIRKVLAIDDGLWIGFSGLGADARVFVDRIRTACQRYRLSYDEKMTVQQLAGEVSRLQQSYTIRGGVRPFGIGISIFGLDKTGTPRLFFSEPSGVCVEWMANAIGQGSKEIRKLLEKNYKEETIVNKTALTIVKSLLEAVQASQSNIEIMVIDVEGLKWC